MSIVKTDWLQIGLDSQIQKSIPPELFVAWNSLDVRSRWEAFTNLLRGWNGGIDPPMDRTMVRIMSIAEGRRETEQTDDYMATLPPESVSPDCIGDFVRRIRSVADANC